jgi:hypothetical protein
LQLVCTLPNPTLHEQRVERSFCISCYRGSKQGLQLLKERPNAIGLSVPAMPRGSPGIDGPVYGGVRDPYDVLLIDRDGAAHVYQSYR